MTEKEANKLAKKIKRCLTSIPNDVIVIIGSDQIKEIMERAESEEGQRLADDVLARLKDTIAYEIQILSDNL